MSFLCVCVCFVCSFVPTCLVAVFLCLLIVNIIIILLFGGGEWGLCTLVCWFAFTLLGAFPKGYCDWLYELLCFSLPFDIFTFPYMRIPRALFFFLSF